jgi:hypothetical protein
MALAELIPMFKKIVEDLGAEEIRQALPILRDIRAALRG